MTGATNGGDRVDQEEQGVPDRVEHEVILGIAKWWWSSFDNGYVEVVVAVVGFWW